MKKISIIFSTLLLSASVIFAGEFKPQLHTTPSVRQQGFGGFFTTDVDNFYSIYANPASMGKRRAHALYPSIDLHYGGPIEDTAKIIDAVTKQDMNTLAEIIKKNNGLKFQIDAQPLLSFGHISGWGFGWGFNTQIFTNASVPGIALADVNAGLEAVLTAGFAFPVINADNLTLSVGATAKGFMQGASSYTGSVLSFINKMKDDPKSLPLYVSTGFSFDVGVYVSLCNTFDFAATWYDPYGMAFIADGTIGSPSFKFNKSAQLDSRLACGFAYHIPVAWSNGVISSFKVMADYRNFYTLFKKGMRNPVLELSCGTEFVLANILALRFGMSEMYPACGIGLSLGTFKIDMAMYGKELGLEPGSAPLLNTSLFIGFTY